MENKVKEDEKPKKSKKGPVLIKTKKKQMKKSKQKKKYPRKKMKQKF